MRDDSVRVRYYTTRNKKQNANQRQPQLHTEYDPGSSILRKSPILDSSVHLVFVTYFTDWRASKHRQTMTDYQASNVPCPTSLTRLGLVKQSPILSTTISAGQSIAHGSIRCLGK